MALAAWFSRDGSRALAAPAAAPARATGSASIPSRPQLDGTTRRRWSWRMDLGLGGRGATELRGRFPDRRAVAHSGWGGPSTTSFGRTASIGTSRARSIFPRPAVLKPTPTSPRSAAACRRWRTSVRRSRARLSGARPRRAPPRRPLSLSGDVVQRQRHAAPTTSGVELPPVLRIAVCAGGDGAGGWTSGWRGEGPPSYGVDS